MNGERIFRLFLGGVIGWAVLLGTSCAHEEASRQMDGFYAMASGKEEAPDRSHPLPVQEPNLSDIEPKSLSPAESDTELDKEQPSGDDASSPALPVPSGGSQPKEEVKAKGIYVSGRMAASGHFQHLLDLVERTDLNAMVIDMKNDSGQFIFPSSVPLAKQIGATDSPMIPEPEAWMQRIKSKNIYTIARIVAFKDPYLASQKPEFAMRAKDGRAWQDAKGVLWIDPYNEDVWEYNLAIAKEAAKLGFDEIQFDYVRFPENGRKVDLEVQYQNPYGRSKAEAIEGFLKKVKEGLKETNVIVSADVFGLTTSSSGDMGIGQDWSKIARHVDVISPMLYPSHYGKGVYGIDNPDGQPYLTVRKAVKDALVKNDEIFRQTGKAPAIRPWFQAFTATWLPSHQRYDTAAIQEQIKAAKEMGLEQFMLWNPSCKYAYE